MKIGVLTYHRSHNYGAYLQSFALTEAIKSKSDIDIEIVDLNLRISERQQILGLRFEWRCFKSFVYNVKRYFMFKRCKNKLPLSKASLVTDDLYKIKAFLEKRYSAIIVGSDEVWKLDGYRGFPNPYWLPDINIPIKISYAVSSRNEYNKLSNTVISEMEDYLSSFSYIGVRDTSTEILINKVCQGRQKIHMNCDPTFAYQFKINKENGRSILRDVFNINTNKKVIGLMCGEPRIAYKIIDQYSNTYEIVSLYYYFKGTKGFKTITPFEWINVIAALDGLITTFFHSMVFAIKTNTPFLVIEGRNLPSATLSKNFDVLNRNGLSNRYIQRNTTDDKTIIEGKIKDLLNFVDSGDVVDFSTTVNRESAMFATFLTVFQELISQNQ